MDIRTYEKLMPTAVKKIGDKKLRFHCPNSFVLWRVETLLSKEPSTIEWLDSMSQGETLLDVGANVGMYSIYAAVMREIDVIAIEPEALNFAILCTNIRLNKQTQRIKAFPIGVIDSSGFTELYISDMRAGGSCHSVGEQLNYELKPKTFPLRQGLYSTTIDELVSQETITIPTHIKIDVDGLEHKVLRGASNTLESSQVRSLSIELNSNLSEHNLALDQLKDYGFKIDQTQITVAQRKSGTFAGVGEVIFRR